MDLTDWTHNRAGRPARHNLDRDGALPLQFSGWQVSSATQALAERYGNDDARVVHVRIYVTEAGQIVTSVSLQDGDKIQWANVTAHDNPKSALESLYHKGKLPAASKAAWLDACRVVPELAPYAFEVA